MAMMQCPNCSELVDGARALMFSHLPKELRELKCPRCGHVFPEWVVRERHREVYGSFSGEEPTPDAPGSLVASTLFLLVLLLSLALASSTLLWPVVEPFSKWHWLALPGGIIALLVVIGISRNRKRTAAEIVRLDEMVADTDLRAVATGSRVASSLFVLVLLASLALAGFTVVWPIVAKSLDATEPPSDWWLALPGGIVGLLFVLWLCRNKFRTGAKIGVSSPDGSPGRPGHARMEETLVKNLAAELVLQQVAQQLEDKLGDTGRRMHAPPRADSESVEQEALEVLLQETKAKPAQEQKANKEQRLPLIFALKHLHILVPASMSDNSKDGSHSIHLMQGERKVPLATDEKIKEFLKQEYSGALPEGTELKLLRMSCQDWPEDALIAFAGITAFGAGNLDRARACARHSLRLDPQCNLARQLVCLLSTTAEVRCPFGTDAAAAPDVPALLAGEMNEQPSPSPHGAASAAVRFSCPSCKSVLGVGSNLAGSVVACSNCKKRLRVPAPAPGLKIETQTPKNAPPTTQGQDRLVNCGCGQQMRVKAASLGKPVRCPKCQRLSIVLTCGCRQLFRVQPEQMGQRVRCPKCRKVVVVPSTHSLNPVNQDKGKNLVFACSKCSKRITVSANSRGKSAKCPSCNQLLRIPAAGGATAGPVVPTIPPA